MRLITKPSILLLILIFTSCGIDDTPNAKLTEQLSIAQYLLEKDSIDSALLKVEASFEYAKSASDLGKAYWTYGYLNELKGISDIAFRYYLAAADSYSAINDWKSEIKLLQNAGTIAYNKNAFYVSLDQYSRRLNVAEENEYLEQVIIGNYEKGLVFRNLLQLDSANFYQNNVLDYVNDQDSMACKAYIELGIIQFYLKNYDSACFLYRKALTRHSSPVLEYKVSQNIANSYYHEKEYDKAMIWFRKAYENAQILDSKRAIIKPIDGIGRTYAAMNEFDSALHYLAKVYPIAESLETPKSRQKMANMRLSSNLTITLVQNYNLINEISPSVADEIGKTYLVDKTLSILLETENLRSQNNKHKINLANNLREQNRLKSKLNEIKRAEQKKYFIFVFLITLLSFFIFLIFRYRKRKSLIASDVDQLLEDTKNRLKGIM